MKLHAIARLYQVRLKERTVLLQEALAILGLSVGVALLFASQIAGASLDGSVERLTTAIVGRSAYQLKARSTEGFSEALLGDVQRLPGVASAVPVLEQDVGLVGPTATRGIDLIATDSRYVKLAGTLLRAFSTQRFDARLLANAARLARSSSRGRQRSIVHRLISQRLLVLPTSIARSIGIHSIGTIAVRTGGQLVPGVLAATLPSSEIGPLEGSPIAIAPLAFAQELTGMHGKVTRILVKVRDGKSEQVRAGLQRLAAGRLNVEPGDFDATLFREAARPINQSTDTFAAICALVGFMFAYCSMLLTADVRRRLALELLTAGATLRETFKALMFDALALGAAGCLLGLALGDALSTFAFKSSPGFLSFAFPVGSQRLVTWQSGVLAICAGMLAATVGVIVPLRRTLAGRRRAGRKGPAATRLAAGMLAGGLACLTVTTLVLLVAPRAAIAGIATLLVALLLLLPLLTVVALKAFDHVQERMALRSTAIAVLELRAPSARIRSVAIASTAAIAVFGCVTIEGSRANLQAGLESSFHGLTSVADLWVVPSGEQSLVGTVPFKGPQASALRSLAGVRAVGIFRSSFLEVGNRRAWILAPSATDSHPLTPSQLLQGRIAIATARLHEGGWAVVSQALAEEDHLHIGQRFVLPSPSPISLRVAALSTNLGWPPGAMIMSPRDYVRAWNSSEPTAYNISISRGAPLARVAREIQAALRNEGASGLTVQTAHAREEAQDAAVRQGLTRLTQMALLALIAGVLAAAISITAVTRQRRRQFARMKAHGLRRNTLWLALLWESALLIGGGCLFGAAFGVYGQLLLSHALTSVTGFPVATAARLLSTVEVVVVVTLAAVMVIAIPGYSAAGVRPSSSP